MAEPYLWAVLPPHTFSSSASVKLWNERETSRENDCTVVAKWNIKHSEQSHWCCPRLHVLLGGRGEVKFAVIIIILRVTAVIWTWCSLLRLLFSTQKSSWLQEKKNNINTFVGAQWVNTSTLTVHNSTQIHTYQSFTLKILSTMWFT